MKKHSGKKTTLYILIPVLCLFVAGYFLIMAMADGKFEKELNPDYLFSQSGWKDLKGPLIKTHWRQDSCFAEFTPGHELLGCWPVAFAQVLAFQGLQANGTVSYTTANGIEISEELSGINLAKVLDTIKEGSHETARYCYQAAVVLQKDFGLGEYRDISIIPAEISEHFHCRVLKHDTGLVEKLDSEISSGNPVVAYFNDILAIRLVTNGHAAVIDGIALVNNELCVHVNFGWGGKSDGWYNFEKLSSERKLKYIFTVSHL